MITFEHTVQDPAGLHARPAGRLIEKAQSFASDIQLTRGTKTVNAKKLFAVMSLAVKSGDVIAFSVAGPDEEAAAAGLRTCLADEGI
jgi:phosphocarrier protein